MVTRVLEKSAIYWPPAPHLKERLESAPVVQPLRPKAAKAKGGTWKKEGPEGLGLIQLLVG